MTSRLNISDYKFYDLVDVVAFSKVLGDFFEATGIPNGVLSNDGEIISQSGWMNACKQFHRQNPQSKDNCLRSDKTLASNLKEGQIVSSFCKNGLMDYATPIVIEGQILATII